MTIQVLSQKTGAPCLSAPDAYFVFVFFFLITTASTPAVTAAAPTHITTIITVLLCESSDSLQSAEESFFTAPELSSACEEMSVSSSFAAVKNEEKPVV